MALDYLIRLRDGVSGAANAASSAISRLQQHMRVLTQETKKASAAFDFSASRFRDANGQFVAGSTRSLTAANLLADGIKAVGSAAAGIVTYLGGAIVGSAIFREKSELRLAALLGDSKAAANEFTAAIKIAERTKFDPKGAVNALSSLSEVFEKQDMRRAFLGAISDAVTITGGGQSEFDHMVLAVKQSMSVGKAQGQDLLQMVNAGLGKKFIYSAIAKNFGIVEKDQEKLNQKAEKMISSGKVSGDRWTLALFDALMARGGAKMAGDVAEKLGSGTIEGLISNIKGGFDTLLGLAGTGDWPAIKTLKALLGDVAALFSTSSDEGKGLTNILRRMSSVASPVLEMMRSDFKALTDALKSGTEGGANFDTMLGNVLVALYSAVKVVGALGYGVAWVTSQFVDFGAWLGESAAKVYLWAEGMSDAGRALVDGLINGIRSAAGRVGEAASQLGQDVLQAVRAALKIASPSRAMAELGAYTAEGFAMGVGSGAGDVRGAVGQMAGAALAGVPEGRGGGGSPTVSQTFQITVGGAGGDVGSVAEEVARQVGVAAADAVEQVLERWAAQGSA